ncbi:MAG: DUF3808 domain-containing protein [Cytophagales bacterium]|nr:DUF3808 domain-containing protein [Cytophagales bacterium]
MNIFVHLFLFIFVAVPAHCKPENPGESLRLAYQQILNLQLINGKNTLFQLSAEDKEQAFFHYLDNLSEIIELLLNENQANYKKYRDNEKARIQKLEELSSDDPYKLYVISEIKLQWAFVKLKFDDALSAGWSIKQAYRLARENMEKFPGFTPNYKTQGTLNLLIGAVPHKYQWLLDLFGLKGSIDEGIQLLSQVEEKNNLFSLEASILKCLAGVYILQDKSLVQSFSEVYATFPDNLLVKFAYAAVSFKSNQSEKALKIIRESEKMAQDYARIHYLDYLKAKILLQKKSYTLAAYYFDRFISGYKGDNNIKDAWFQLFLCYWLNNRQEKARKMYEIAKVEGAPVSTADKYAGRLLKNNEFPHVQIMQIRLATDGGYYDLAEALINSLSASRLDTHKNKTELVYRKARLLHLQGKLPEASQQYRKTIGMTQKEPWYFAPSAALQLGHIYIKQKNYALADKYFQTVLNFRNHPYKQSLDQQARSAIQRLNGLGD